MWQLQGRTRFLARTAVVSSPPLARDTNASIPQFRDFIAVQRNQALERNSTTCHTVSLFALELRGNSLLCFSHFLTLFHGLGVKG